MTSWVRKIHDFAFEFEDIRHVYRCIHRSLCSFLNKRMTISTVSGYIAINQNKMIAITARGEVSASSEYFCNLLVVPYSGILNFRSTTVIKKLFTQKYCTNSGVTFDTAQMTLLLDYSSGIFLSLSVLPTIFLPNQKKNSSMITCKISSDISDHVIFRRPCAFPCMSCDDFTTSLIALRDLSSNEIAWWSDDGIYLGKAIFCIFKKKNFPKNDEMHIGSWIDPYSFNTTHRYIIRTMTKYFNRIVSNGNSSNISWGNGWMTNEMAEFHT